MTRCDVPHDLFAGMTNRKDMIDDALLRPGRLEVQMEIGKFICSFSHLKKGYCFLVPR